MHRDFEQVLSVSELTAAIQKMLEGRLSHICVQGEISNFKAHSSGHLYFDLKDRSAKVPAVMFRNSQRLDRLPKEGDHVIAEGAIAVYPPHGKYQIVVRSLRFAGEGALLLQFEALKKELQALGWFDRDKKKPLPKFPKVIGVITSPTGAVIQDIIHVLKRRFSGFHLILNPVRVQGREAPEEIALAIEQFNRHSLAEVLIVARGGGSLEDLWAFNEKKVVEAIFLSRIPVISAVGHETDVTLADFAADVRAPTPSAAAEMAISEKIIHLDKLGKSLQSLQICIRNQLRPIKMRLALFLHHPLFTSPFALLGAPMQRMDEFRMQMDRHLKTRFSELKIKLAGRQNELKALNPSSQILHCKERISDLEKRLSICQKERIRHRQDQLGQLARQLESVNPKKVLKRGYSILFAQKTGSVIMSKQQLSPKLRVRALLADGEAMLEVHDRI